MSAEADLARPLATYQVVRTPVWPVLVAASGAIGSSLCAAAEIFGEQAGSLAVSVAGYVLGSLLTTVFVVAHRLFKQRATRNVWFSPRPRLDRLAQALLAGGLALGFWHAFVLATEIAKR